MSEDCPSCERYLHDHAEVFAELAALREKLSKLESELRFAYRDDALSALREKLKGATSALAKCFPLSLLDGTSPAMDPASPEAMAAVINGYTDSLREKCERLENGQALRDMHACAETYREGLERIAEDAHAKFCPVIWPFVCLPCIARETLEKGEKK